MRDARCEMRPALNVPNSGANRTERRWRKLNSMRSRNCQYLRLLKRRNISRNEILVFISLIFQELLFSYLAQAPPVQTMVFYKLPRVHIRHRVCLQRYRQLYPLFRNQITIFFHQVATHARCRCFSTGEVQELQDAGVPCQWQPLLQVRIVLKKELTCSSRRGFECCKEYCSLDYQRIREVWDGERWEG